MTWYRKCQLSYDGDAPFERVAYFFEDQGEEEVGLFEVGDRRCYQGNDFIPTDTEPDLEELEYGYHRFIVVFPEDFDPEEDTDPLPLYINLRGGTAGWVDQDVPVESVNSWALDFTEDPDFPEWVKGAFRDRLEFAQPTFSEQNMIMRMLDQTGFEAELRLKNDPRYAFLILSGCSFDCHNGREELGETELDFIEAERTRFSYVVTVEALQFIRLKYGIDHVYAGAQSGGGKGAFILARDLSESDEFFAEEGRFRGAIMASAPAEFDGLATLFAQGDTIMVDADSSCSNPDEAEVPADHGGEPLATAFAESGASGYSASEAIDQELIDDVPLLHIWSTRDPAHAYDRCFSESFIHGPIRTAINGRSDEPFAFSENMEVCIGSCKSLDAVPVAVHCVTHALMEEEAVVDCALDWIAEINDFWVEEDAYATPASCASPEPDIDLDPQVLCRDQNDM